jgi:hypothetical protein
MPSRAGASTHFSGPVAEKVLIEATISVSQPVTRSSNTSVDAKGLRLCLAMSDIGVFTSCWLRISSG